MPTFPDWVCIGSRRRRPTTSTSSPTSALLGIAVALGLAAVVAERRVVQVILLTALVQAAPHLIFHLTHADALGGGQVLLSRSSLAVPVVLALGLLWLTRHPDHSVMAAETVGRPTALGSSR